MSKQPTKKSMENFAADESNDVNVSPDNGTESTGGTDQSKQTATSADPVEEMQTELAAANNRLLRTQAELENYRKRVQRDMEQQRRYATLPLISELLTVVDNIQRAIEAAEKNEGSGGLLEGIKMVATQLTDALERHHCKPIPAVGEPFDPHLHEALGHMPSEEHPPNTVIMETRTGYQLHDRVVRPSQVFISSGPPGDADSQQPESQQKNNS